MQCSGGMAKGLVGFAAMILAGCATFSQDGGLDGVKAVTAQHIKQVVVWTKTTADQNAALARVDTLLAKPMDVDSAVQIALLNNKGLQASLHGLGISEADVVQAGRLPNPKFSMLYARNNGDYKIEQALTLNIFSLLTLPTMQEIARRNFEQTKLLVASEVLTLAYQTRVAYFNAVAANEHLRYSQQVKDSAEASALLGKRMLAAGHWNALEQSREQSYYADAVLDEANAALIQNSCQEALMRLLGLDTAPLVLENRLPDLPLEIAALQPFVQMAFEQRLDVRASQLETQNLAKQLGLTKTTRFINVLELGPARVLEGRRGDAYKNGVDISVELPLFDWGQAKVAKAESLYMQAVNRTTQVALNAQSEVREAYSRYRNSYTIAKHYHDEIIPLRKKVLEEQQLRYNGMLTSPFELFATARAQVASVNAYIEALNQFWLAEAALHMALVGSMKEGK